MKRRRGDDGLPTRDVKRIATAINSKINAKYPYRSYGRMYVPRGVKGSAQNMMFGDTWKGASALQRADRKMYGYSGRGDYQKDFLPWAKKWVPKGTFSALGGLAGSALGSMTGTPMLGSIGSGLGSRFSRYAGFGPYTSTDSSNCVPGNQIMGGGRGVSAPLMVNTSGDVSGDVFITHREFIGNVTATGAAAAGASLFNIQSFPVNAGLVGTFPWLAQIAANFSLYELEGCIYQYVPTSGEFGTIGNNTLGKVILATQYDPDAALFASSREMENYDYVTSTKPSIAVNHGIETANPQRATNMLYVRTGATTKDLVFTDIGTFQIATEGVPLPAGAGAVFNLGELWVSYKVRLSRAKLFNANLLAGSLVDQFVGSATLTMADNTAVFVAASAPLTARYNVAVAPFFAPHKSNTIGCTITSTNLTDIVILWPLAVSTGNYAVHYRVADGANVAVSLSATRFFTNCIPAIDPATGIALVPSAGIAPNAAVATGNFHYAPIYVTINAPGVLQASVTIRASVVLSATCSTVVEIYAVPAAFIS